MGSEKRVATAARRKREASFRCLRPRARVMSSAAMAATYQLLGLGEGVLHVREAETGHSDELAHHRHKLVSQLLRPLFLVIELLHINNQRELTQRHMTQDTSRYAICLSGRRDSRFPRSSSRCAGCRCLFPARSCCKNKPIIETH